MSIYSVRLYANEVPASSNTVIYTVASGITVVVRCIDVVAAAPGATGQAQVSITGKAFLFSGTFSATAQYLAWRGRQVLNAGDGLAAITTSSAVYFCISGYQFQN